MGNRVEDAANAFIDVLKYSDNSVDYPDFKDIEPWPDDVIVLFNEALKNQAFSEQTSILMYTKQSSDFEPISELMLGIGLVEMRHYDRINDFLKKAEVLHHDNMDIHIDLRIGKDAKDALNIALKAEEETISHYKKIMNVIRDYMERSDYDDVYQFLTKLIFDEEHHIKLLKEALKDYPDPASITVIL